MKTTFEYDHYYDYATIKENCLYFAKSYPELVELQSIYKTEKLRDIFALTLTNKRNGNALAKPAIYIDANTHAGEVCGSMVAMHTIDYLLTNYGSDAEVTRLLDDYTFYIIPRISVDGSEVYLKQAYNLRSVDREYLKEDEGIYQEDLDDDNTIRMMRIKNPLGKWKKDPEHELAMIHRLPDDIDGEFYDVYIEGMLDKVDQLNLFEQRNKWGLDFNRNYPYGWFGEHRQSGAGAYPLSNPENKAVVDFFLAHHNIGVVLTHHTSGGVILYPPGTTSEKQADADDIKMLKEIGAMGSKEMDYSCINIFDNFNEDQEFFPSGAFDDWCYQEQGVLAYTLELWDVRKKAGQPVDWFAKEPETSQKKLEVFKSLIAFAQKEGLDVIKPWEKVEHPQFKEVEVGGIAGKFLIQNPPCKFLQQEVENATRFTLRYAKSLPKIMIYDHEVTKLNDDTYKVDITLANKGYLPTYISKEAKKINKAQPIKVTILNGEVSDGNIKQVDGLAGYALVDSDYSYYGNINTENREDLKAKVSFIVKTTAASIDVIVFSEKAGKDSLKIDLMA
ncbi:MAG: M14 family metallopeptidase [Erysipelotrichaceae bacterium]|nr:M14 family metallopeptidase [Erysipelotrichaceae bacterium]